jgi:hypothetical protein
MTQSLSAYWQRLTHRISDDAERPEAPVLDLAGCFGTPAMATLRPDTIVARFTSASPTPSGPR